MTAWAVGQVVVVVGLVRYTHWSAEGEEATITKVGRRWVTVTKANGVSDRFDAERGHLHYTVGSSPGQVYASREAWAQAKAAGELARKVRAAVTDWPGALGKLSLADLAEVADLLGVDVPDSTRALLPF